MLVIGRSFQVTEVTVAEVITVAIGIAAIAGITEVTAGMQQMTEEVFRPTRKLLSVICHMIKGDSGLFIYNYRLARSYLVWENYPRHGMFERK